MSRHRVTILKMPFIYQRTIRFQDTDAAGVVYFANVLAICHEAYEESLAALGIDLKSFFNNPDAAVPIVHASVDFFHPLFCGDKVSIHLTPQYKGADYFEIAYQMLAPSEQQIAKVITEHVCVHPTSRNRQQLPSDMMQWFKQWVA